MISREREADILRLHHVEKWPVGTIAIQLGLHHDVVERALIRDGLPALRRPRRCKWDAYASYVDEVLREFPRLCASRIYHMCCARGYQGSEVHFRRLVAQRRPRPSAEAYLRLRTFPGEQGQVDWGHFGTLRIGRAERPLVAFVIVLSYSRRIFLRFFLGQQTENFLRGHALAFVRFGGCPRILLYDNLKSAVLERRGDFIRYNPVLLAFTAHYRVQPRPVAVARGNEKGRVERAIQYVRHAFFAARRFTDLADLNAQAEEWCDGPALARPWPEDRCRTVAEAFAEEQAQLVPLPATDFPLDERREVAVGKTPYVRFDSNDYSVPHEHVRRTLTVLADETIVRILDGVAVIATHSRSFDRGSQVEDPQHIARLVQFKRLGRKHRGFARLYHATPCSEELIRRLAERGENLGSATNALLKLLDEYGAAALAVAISTALARGVTDPYAVRQLLDQTRRAANAPPPIQVQLPDDPRVRDLAVRPHALQGYDEIAGHGHHQEGADHGH